MGKLLKPRGLSGEIRLLVFNAVDSTLKIGMEVWVESDNGEYSNHLIESLKILGVKSWIKFTGCDGCKDAHQLSGLNFLIPRNLFEVYS